MPWRVRSNDWLGGTCYATGLLRGEGSIQAPLQGSNRAGAGAGTAVTSLRRTEDRQRFAERSLCARSETHLGTTEGHLVCGLGVLTLVRRPPQDGRPAPVLTSVTLLRGDPFPASAEGHERRGVGGRVFGSGSFRPRCDRKAAGARRLQLRRRSARTLAHGSLCRLTSELTGLRRQTAPGRGRENSTGPWSGQATAAVAGPVERMVRPH
jgi:hypothetical protein